MADGHDGLMDDAAKMAEIEREQEEKLKAKYGGLKPKAKLMPKDHKFFDSADWAMQQQGKPAAPKPGSGLRASKEIPPGALQGKPGAPSGE